MKTGPLDFLLSTLAITLLTTLAAVTAFALSIDNPYHVVLDVAAFLLAYGLYTTGLLVMLRRIWPYPEGRFTMDSWAFTYWKLVAVLTDLGEKTLRPFTTVFTLAPICAAFGAHIGRQTALGGVFRDLPLLHIGDYATVGQNSVMTAHAITHNKIELKRVRIGKNAVVGINCVVMPGVTLGDNAVLAPGAVATTDTQIPANELWGGVPARKIKELVS